MREWFARHRHAESSSMLSRPVRALTAHFFGRFFQTNMPSGTGAHTALLRALCTIAAPMLMAAFWTVTLARGVHPWSDATMHYLYVLYSFVSMGCITTVLWESLFPDRTDFLILLPMPLASRVMFLAKLLAVSLVLGAFLLAANLFGTLLLPMLMGARILTALGAHAAAVFCAGLAGSFSVLALEGLIVCAIPERWFRRIAPLVQTMFIALLLTLLFLYGSVGANLPELLSGSTRFALWFPPLWFLALYECMLGGPTATVHAHMLAYLAVFSVPVIGVCAIVTYPAAWARRKRLALEGEQARSRSTGHLMQGWLHLTLLRSADERAVFHFIYQTLARLSSYHVSLAAYFGTGLALCMSAALRLSVDAGTVHYRASHVGAQAALPLLLFWIVAGLRSAFGMPADLSARWIFRMAPLTATRVTRTARMAVWIVCACAGTLALAAMMVCAWDRRAVTIQLVFGVAMTIVLSDLFFFFEASVPFTRPRLPGRTSLPITLSIYTFGLPAFVVGVVALELRTSAHTWQIALVLMGAFALHSVLRWLRQLPSYPASEDTFLDESEDDFIALGLST